jgi:hypothetical protein
LFFRARAERRDQYCKKDDRPQASHKNTRSLFAIFNPLAARELTLPFPSRTPPGYRHILPGSSQKPKGRPQLSNIYSNGEHHDLTLRVNVQAGQRHPSGRFDLRPPSERPQFSPGVGRGGMAARGARAATGRVRRMPTYSRRNSGSSSQTHYLTENRSPRGCTRGVWPLQDIFSAPKHYQAVGTGTG